jgi:AcrR family transcriptional regulator
MGRKGNRHILECQLQFFPEVSYPAGVATARTTVTPNRRGARSRELVLDAAERVMARDGYASASITDIVNEAGIPISSVYHYFGSKDGVLLAVMERGADRFFADLGDPDQLIGTPTEHLTAVATGLVAALEEHPDFLKLVVIMAAQPPAKEAAQAHEVVTRVRDQALRRLRKQLALAFDLDPRSATIGRLARFCLAVIDGAFIAHQADPHVKLDTLIGPMPAALAAMHATLES